MANGQNLPVRRERNGNVAVGYCTPEIDKKPQAMCVPPNRVLPIIFIPGIMGSNLRLTPARQKEMGNKNNVAWRPDLKGSLWDTQGSSPTWRQKMLDPDATEVDSYDPQDARTGDPFETALMRNSNVISSGYGNYRGQIEMSPSIFLWSDPYGVKDRKTKEQKALERGWGEVYFGSYGSILMEIESNLNDPFGEDGEPSNWWMRSIIGTSPLRWGAVQRTPLEPVTADMLKHALTTCWFPVHAMGYNWLQSNRRSGQIIADRVRKLMESYRAQGYECKKVIFITHSMGGLAARAAMHQAIGGLQDDVLGVVHGVMPAIGAGAAYKRMRCGCEGMVQGILGKNGQEVTAVLASSQGGMELLPTAAYGNGWLQAIHEGSTLMSFPKKGDPYEEIYKVQGKWFQLFNPDWVNPSGLRFRGIENALSLLDKTKQFHQEMHGYYHPNSYANYGADPQRRTWRKVVWNLDKPVISTELPNYLIMMDDADGRLRLAKRSMLKDTLDGKLKGEENYIQVPVSMADPDDPGDQTVPVHSADDQFISEKFKGIFRQVGYEHQASCKARNVVDSTCYSLIRIIQEMRW